MSIKNDQSGAAHIVAVLLVILIAAVGVVGWRVWDNQKQDDTTTSKTSSSANTNTATDSSNTAVESVKITALGVKVNDPDGRKLQLHTEKICAAECANEDSYFIRDDNSDYFGRCDYPAGVQKLDQATIDGRPDIVKISKKIGSSYYRVTSGSNSQSPCGDTKDENYVADLKQYILDNLEVL